MTTEPEHKLITREEYIADIKARWSLFVKEWNAFVEDIKKLIAFLQPYVTKAVDTVKRWITKLKAKKD